MNKQEILNEIEKMENRLADFKQELNKDEEWKPKDGEEYWYYDRDLEEVRKIINLEYSSDRIRMKNKLIFRTKAEAKRYEWYQIKKEAYSYKFSKEEWEDTELRKYYIILDTKENGDQLPNIDWLVYRQSIGQIFFKTEAKAQEFIDKYKAEILEFEFGIKE